MPETDATPENPNWPQWAPHYLRVYAKTCSATRAAEGAGISRVTAWRLIQRDETFALAVHDAREQALDLLEEVAYAAGTHGLPKVTEKHFPDGTVERTETVELNHILLMFVLKRYRPEFRESYRIEQTGPGGGPIKVEIDDVAADFDREVRRLTSEE